MTATPIPNSYLEAHGRKTRAWLASLGVKVKPEYRELPRDVADFVRGLD